MSNWSSFWSDLSSMILPIRENWITGEVMENLQFCSLHQHWSSWPSPPFSFFSTYCRLWWNFMRTGTSAARSLIWEHFWEFIVIRCLRFSIRYHHWMGLFRINCNWWGIDPIRILFWLITDSGIYTSETFRILMWSYSLGR